MSLPHFPTSYVDEHRSYKWEGLVIFSLVEGSGSLTLLNAIFQLVNLEVSLTLTGHSYEKLDSSFMNRVLTRRAS